MLTTVQFKPKGGNSNNSCNLLYSNQQRGKSYSVPAWNGLKTMPMFALKKTRALWSPEEDQSSVVSWRRPEHCGLLKKTRALWSKRRQDFSLFLAGTEEPFTVHTTASWEDPASVISECGLNFNRFLFVLLSARVELAGPLYTRHAPLGTLRWPGLSWQQEWTRESLTM